MTNNCREKNFDEQEKKREKNERMHANNENYRAEIPFRCNLF